MNNEFNRIVSIGVSLIGTVAGAFVAAKVNPTAGALLAGASGVAGNYMAQRSSYQDGFNQGRKQQAAIIQEDKQPSDPMKILEHF